MSSLWQMSPAIKYNLRHRMSCHHDHYFGTHPLSAYKLSPNLFTLVNIIKWVQNNPADHFSQVLLAFIHARKNYTLFKNKLHGHSRVYKREKCFWKTKSWHSNCKSNPKMQSSNGLDFWITHNSWLYFFRSERNLAL